MRNQVLALHNGINGGEVPFLRSHVGYAHINNENNWKVIY